MKTELPNLPGAVIRDYFMATFPADEVTLRGVRHGQTHRIPFDPGVFNASRLDVLLSRSQAYRRSSQPGPMHRTASRLCPLVAPHGVGGRGGPGEERKILAQ